MTDKVRIERLSMALRAIILVGSKGIISGAMVGVIKDIARTALA